MGLLRVTREPHGRIDTISQLAHNLVLAIVEHISDSDRMIASVAVPADALLGDGAHRLCSIGSGTEYGFQAVYAGVKNACSHHRLVNVGGQETDRGGVDDGLGRIGRRFSRLAVEKKNY